MLDVKESIGKLDAKLDRLSSDYNKQETELRNIEKAMIMAKALLAAIFVVVPLCGTVLWWAVGGKIEQIRDGVIDKGAEAAAQKVADPVVKPPQAPAKK